jgi:CheY-like chemotaxis protein/HPt (histidine-containing phosphotransfer) domain-containing protein/anti-sigma regulatory factor (Ser/Thr protein kinase)
MGRLLGQTPLSPKQQEFVDSILLSGEALLSVINDILDYSKIESSKMELEYKPFSLKRCIEETFDLQASKAIEKNLSLQYSIARDVPNYVYGDIMRLRQILMNLVSNAIKFTAKGKVSINVSSKVSGDNKLELRFDVKDTGIGIPADKIGKLFRSFSQAEADTSKKFGGTGLGLVICKNLVEMMHGKIWIESREGEGSDFIFTIQSEKVKPEDVPKQNKNGTNRLANSYVLIVSDDRAEADLYADYFKRWGMIPQISSDSARAADTINQRNDFNLVLIDTQLISTNAIDLAGKIRNIRSKDELPIVFFNAVKTDDIFFDYTNEIVSAVIPKNVDRSKVLDILISVFSVEDHQRSRDEQAMSASAPKLADEVPIRILIAEDNLVNQKLAQNIFEGFGYKPVIVSNGLQVIDEMRKNPFDLIFMDVQMPEMDGFEATRFIRIKLQPSVRPVIVAMTAFALEGDKEKCIEAGMDDYISKPFLVEEIVDKIRQWGKGKPSGSKTETKENVNREKKEGTVILNMKSIMRLKEMTAGSDPAFFNQVVNMFINQADEQIYDMSKALSSGNWKEMSSIAHKMKGSSLNIGAEALAETCRKIELKGIENDSEGMDALVKKLAQEIVLTKGELKALS